MNAGAAAQLLLPIASRRGLVLSICALGAAAWVVGALAEPPGANIPRHVLLFLLSFLFYLIAVVSVLANGREGQGISRRALWLALAWAVLLRLALLFTAPSLSDDVFRYVWDGKVLNAGIDPYAYPPSAPQLAWLHSSLWNGINHKTMPTPYPPLAEGLFALVYRLAPESLTAMQATAVLFDLGIIAVLMMLLGRMGMDRGRVLIYAWNPLVLVQFAHSAHFDPAMILPLLGAILLLSTGRRVLSGISLGLSILVKLVPAMLGPLFLPAWAIAGAVSAGVAVLAGTLPFLGTPALSGVLSEASDARFNDSLGYLMMRLLTPVTHNPDSAARTVSAVALVIGILAVTLALWMRGADWRDLPRAVYYVVGLFLLLNAVVEPWYLTWILPFLCFALPSRHEPRWWSSPSWGWLLLTGSAVLTDLTYVQSAGSSAWIWVRAVEYCPLYLLLVLWAWRRRAHLLPPHPVRS